VELKEKFELSGLTLKDVAAKLGKSISTVSDVINGNYNTGKSELYRVAIEKICDEKISKLAQSNNANEAWLSLAQLKIKDRLERMIGSGLSFFELILGDSGMGKTHLLKEMAKERGALYVKARASQSASAFMSMLLKAMGEKARGNTDEKLERFCEVVEDTKTKLIIVDEADLFAKDKDATFERKFELLREVFEYANANKLGVTVVAVGLPLLKKRVDKLGGYLQSRLTYSPEMTLSVDELETIGRLKGIDEDMGKFLANGHNARLYEKAANNIALGYDQRVAANLVYSVRR
jgi:DNA transposition AAA+ family ATPase